jgi:hypothetical protein
MNLLKGQKIVLLKVGTVDYIQIQDQPLSPYTHLPSGNAVTPTVYLATMTKDETIVVDPTDYITDSNSPTVVYPKIVGPRPKNIVRR